MYKATEVAHGLILLADSEKGLVNELPPLKLQKLLFYAQGWYAANRDARFFEEDLYAWPYGPVVPEVYEEFQNFGAQDLKKQKKQIKAPAMDEVKAKDIAKNLKPVLRVYGNMSAYELVARTHEEEVWRKNFGSGNKLMPFDEIKRAFKLKLQNF